jgi:hypothetical protein
LNCWQLLRVKRQPGAIWISATDGEAEAKNCDNAGKDDIKTSSLPVCRRICRLRPSNRKMPPL